MGNKSNLKKKNIVKHFSETSSNTDSVSSDYVSLSESSAESIPVPKKNTNNKNKSKKPPNNKNVKSPNNKKPPNNKSPNNKNLKSPNKKKSPNNKNLQKKLRKITSFSDSSVDSASQTEDLSVTHTEEKNNQHKSFKKNNDSSSLNKLDKIVDITEKEIMKLESQLTIEKKKFHELAQKNGIKGIIRNKDEKMEELYNNYIEFDSIRNYVKGKAINTIKKSDQVYKSFNKLVSQNLLTAYADKKAKVLELRLEIEFYRLKLKIIEKIKADQEHFNRNIIKLLVNAIKERKNFAEKMIIKNKNK